MPILSVRNLTKTFTSGWWPFAKRPSYTAVNDISFEIQKGEILGLLGPNGAGKTTTIQMLLGTLTPTTGSIAYFGQNFTQHRIAALKRIGYASGYDRFPARLTVTNNLDIVGRIYGMSAAHRAQQIEKLLKFFGIWELKDRQTGTLSAGQTTRVMLAKAFLAEPEIVLLDEPTASLDPDIALEVRRFIKEQRKERNVSLLITSHNMDEVTDLCDRVLVLKKGTIVADNTPAQLAGSISKAKVHLTMPDGTVLTKELDEHAIAQYLIDLSRQNITYTQISIDKPTLEDYFLSVAQTKERV